ncbi:MAG TPA: transcriptional repressor [Acidimicrobiales bacterium]|nr:transcriptional repressor [Acidimicrobiales bacterium]
MGKTLSPHHAELADVATVDDALALVRARGGRATPSRRILLEVLFEAPRRHMTAEELAQAVRVRAPDVHLSTIYRNLEELERLGVVVHTHLGHSASAYQLASSAHGHFLCEECGKTIEVPDALFNELTRSATAEFGFSVNPHHFAILGRCADCS